MLIVKLSGAEQTAKNSLSRAFFFSANYQDFLYSNGLCLISIIPFGICREAAIEMQKRL